MKWLEVTVHIVILEITYKIVIVENTEIEYR